MKKNIFYKKFITFIIIFIFSTNLSALNLATINIAYILEKSLSYNNFLDELSIKKLELQNTLNIKETKLEKLKQDIDSSKLIL